MRSSAPQRAARPADGVRRKCNDEVRELVFRAVSTRLLIATRLTRPACPGSRPGGRRRGSAGGVGWGVRRAAPGPTRRHRRAGHPPAAGAARAGDRVGQVGGVLDRHATAARVGRGPDPGGLAAARPHAQPGPCRLHGGYPCRHDQLVEHRRLAPDRGRDRGRPGRRAADLTGATEQPAVPYRGAGVAHRGGGHARRRRGALHLGLGPRLPARLPPHSRCPGRARPDGTRARRHGDRQREGLRGPGHPDRRPDAHTARIARQAEPAPVSGAPGHRPRTPGLARRVGPRPRWAGSRLLPDRLRGRADGGVPRARWCRGRCLHRGHGVR